MKRGVVLLCISDAKHREYGEWAHNMAVSIKAYSPDMSVQVIGDGTAEMCLPKADKSPYDIVTKMSQDDYLTKEGRLFPALAKLNIYKYAAFDEYIYLDVDGILIKDITPLFDDCKTFFECQVNGVSTLENDNLDASLWAKTEIIWEHYGLKPDAVMPGINSSFHYARKGKEAKAIFTNALKNLANPIPINQQRYKWGQSQTQPDELYMNIALAQVGHIPKIKPILYLRRRNDYGAYAQIEDIIANYYVIGCWGDASYNHKEISGNGDRRTGLYNKLCAECFKIYYGDAVPFTAHFFKLVNGKVYARPINTVVLRETEQTTTP